MMSKELSHKIYYSTLVLVILVIGLHSSFTGFLNPNLDGYSFSLAFQRVFLTIGDATVPTFFVISGYLLFSNFTLKEYPKMLLKKVFSLVIPYFIWSILGFLFARIIFPLLNHESIELTFQSVALDILLANCCPQIWFVRTLVVFCICSPLLYFVFKYLKKWSIFIPIIVFTIYIFFRPDYFKILFWIPLFFVGSYLAYFRIPVINKYKPRLIAAISISILLVISILLAVFDVSETGTLYFCYRHLSVVLIWLSIDVIYSLFSKENINDVFKLSAFLFFSHVFITWSISYLLQQIAPLDSNYKCVLFFFRNWIISSLICIGLGYTLKRFANPVYKFLGGRN